MNASSQTLSVVNLSILPLYVLYVALYSKTFQERLKRKVYQNLNSFLNRTGSVKKWRIALLYETFKNDHDLSPKAHYAVEVSMGGLFASRWKPILVAQVDGPSAMLTKLKSSGLPTLPKSLRADHYIHTQGSSQAWRQGFFIMAAFPFGVELMRMVFFS
jgi:hypothetical protein